MTTYDSIITEVGAFGWWQACLLALIGLPDVFYAFALILPVFTGATPPFGCSGGGVEEGGSLTVGFIL